MKRDDDMLREILFEFEEQKDWLVAVLSSLGMSEERRMKLGHVNLLCDAGMVTEVGDQTFRLTNSGHDYLDAIRNDTIWNKTKSGAAEVGGMTLQMMKDLALSYVKQEVAAKLGVTL
ncbi:DUF2513 domain-containing protein [uncultured Aliiroseovarius sp.]|uniref:DUF2513 domain-containing protein n=1 Tax=uncultured Aliiroseovarius sp. TaxID=1658783 RepID=UPI00260570A1|nr:DUF2513 domain-containing protein [uncultured Aliiroseovarius sp.]